MYSEIDDSTYFAFRNLNFAILRKGAGPCATESCEPRQVRKEATVSRLVWVPQDHLAPVFS